MRLDVVGDDNGNQPLGIDLGGDVPVGSFDDGGWLYYRFWMKFSSDFSWGSTLVSGARAKSGRIKQTAEVKPLAFTGFIRKDGISIGECERCEPKGPDPFIPYDFQAEAGTGWHEYIVSVKKQTGRRSSDAQFHLYVDGREVGTGLLGLQIYDLSVSLAEAWGSWMVQPFFQLLGGPGDGGTIWLDDFSTDTNWNSLISPQGPLA